MIAKSFEIFTKHNGYGFISESFSLNGYIFVASTNKKLLLPLSCSRLNTNFLFDCVKLIEYLASAVNVLSSYVSPLPIIKIYLFLLSLYTDEFISAPKIMTFFPMFPSVK